MISEIGEPVANLFDDLRARLIEEYDVWRLVDQRHFEEFGKPHLSQQVICDIDKTYLETEFEKFSSLAKIPFEGAEEKKTVPGASIVLRCFRWGDMDDISDQFQQYPKPLHFVSASPPQLRRVLREKLVLDSLDWSSDTFKNQVYNLSRGEFKRLRNQVGYKTAAILKLITNGPAHTAYTMIGDNAEADAQIYMGIKLFVENKISVNTFKRYLLAMGIKEQEYKTLIPQIKIPEGITVPGIFIRRLRNKDIRHSEPISSWINYFDSFLHLACYFVYAGLLELKMLWSICRYFHNKNDVSLDVICGILEQAALFFSNKEEVEAMLQLSQGLKKLRSNIKPTPFEDNFLPPKLGAIDTSLTEEAIELQLLQWVPQEHS